MKTLQINPTKHDIFLGCDHIEGDDSGYANVNVRLSEDAERTVGCLTKKDALTISKWFADLAKEIEKAEKAYKSQSKKESAIKKKLSRSLPKKKKSKALEEVDDFDEE